MILDIFEESSGNFKNFDDKDAWPLIIGEFIYTITNLKIKENDSNVNWKKLFQSLAIHVNELYVQYARFLIVTK